MRDNSTPHLRPDRLMLARGFRVGKLALHLRKLALQPVQPVGHVFGKV